MLKAGLLIRLDDIETGFSEGNPKEGRPYLITALVGDPLDYGYVVPRSTKGFEGVETPPNEPPGLNMTGRFLLDPFWVSAETLEAAEAIDMLPAEHWKKVQAMLNRRLQDI